MPTLFYAVNISGYADGGDYWRAKYETPDFEQKLARLWRQVRPLYEQLHAYVARRLRAHYKDYEFPSSGHIPAHLFGKYKPKTKRPRCTNGRMAFTLEIICRHNSITL